MSPSQRATRGDERPARPTPAALLLLAVQRVECLVQRLRSVPDSATPVPSASPPPRTSRHRRSRSSVVRVLSHPSISRSFGSTRAARSWSRLSVVGGGRAGDAAECPGGATWLADGAAFGGRRSRRTCGAATEAAGRTRRRPAPVAQRSTTASSSGSCTSRAASPDRNPSSQRRGGRRVGRRATAAATAAGPPRSTSTGPASSSSRACARPAMSPCTPGCSATTRQRPAATRSRSSSVVEQGDAALHAVEQLAHGHGRVVVERSARRRQPDRHPGDHARDHARHQLGVRAPHVAVAANPGHRLDGRHQPRRVVLARGAFVQSATARSRAPPAGRRRAWSPPARRARRASASAARCVTTAVAACSIVVPYAGRLDQRHLQLRAPLQQPRLPERPARAAHLGGPAPRHVEQQQPVQQLRLRPGATRSAGPGRGSARPRSAACAGSCGSPRGPGRAAPSGVSAGTWPRMSPTRSLRDTSRIGTVEPPHEHGLRGLLVTSVRPGSGRSRSAASACASRTASITARRRDVVLLAAQQPRHPHQPAGDHVVRRGEQVVVPAGGVDARAVARRPREPAVTSTAPRWPRPWLPAAPSAARCPTRPTGSVSGTSTGACQAPHTTAIVPGSPRRAARITWRMAASRRRVVQVDVLGASRRVRIASSTAPNTSRPWQRCSIASSHQRSGVVVAGGLGERGDRVEPVLGPLGRSSRSTSGVGGRQVEEPQRAGRARPPSACACHSGENTAIG